MSLNIDDKFNHHLMTGLGEDDRKFGLTELEGALNRVSIATRGLNRHFK